MICILKVNMRPQVEVERAELSRVDGSVLIKERMIWGIRS